MSSKYYVIFTNIGMAKLANATALGSQLKITHMAVGDGAGVVPDPKESQTTLINECYRAQLNSLSIDKTNANQIIAELVLPETVGGWYVRETGLYDEDGDLIAVANAPESYKPQLQEGAGRSQVVKMVLIVSNTDAVTLKIDPAVVLATRQYVDELAIMMKEMSSSKLSKSENLSDLDDVSAAVNNLGIGRYLIEKGENANGWYEIYSDGWIRLGRSINTAYAITTSTPAIGVVINYPISFKNPPHFVSAISLSTIDNGLEYCSITSETLSSITIASYSNTRGSSSTAEYLSKWAGFYIAEGY